jgi:hypothetical protein
VQDEHEDFCKSRTPDIIHRLSNILTAKPHYHRRNRTVIFLTYQSGGSRHEPARRNPVPAHHAGIRKSAVATTDEEK